MPRHMTSEPEAGSGARLRLALYAAMAVSSVLLAWFVAGIYANEPVSADDWRGHAECGSPFDPNAVTSECSDALQDHAWVATATLGFCALVALSAVVAVGRRRPLRPLLAGALAIAVATVLAGWLWAGAIERTTGA